MSKLDDAGTLILEAEFLVDLIETALSNLIERTGPFEIASQTIRAKLGEAARLLNEAEREAREAEGA